MAIEYISATYTAGADLTVEAARLSDGARYDWDDGTFKASGWTTRFAPLPEDALTPGLYRTSVSVSTWLNGTYNFVFALVGGGNPLSVASITVASGVVAPPAVVSEGALASLDEVRSRLGLSVDAERDAILEAFRLAAEERILDLTGFLTTEDPYFAPVSKTEDLADVQRGVSRLLRYRPVLTVACSARWLGGSTFTSVTADIRNAAKGRVMVVGSDMLTGIDQTSGYRIISGRPPWTRWQETVFATVRFAYTVDPLGSETNPVPKSLNRAVVEWAAFFFSVPSHGAVQSYSAESISETFSTFDETDMPRNVRALIARYVRGQAGIVT